MKFTVTMKDPDTLDDAISDAIEQAVTADELPDEEERNAVRGIRKDKVRDLCRRWFEYGEYLAVEIDTVAETITVKPVRQ